MKEWTVEGRARLVTKAARKVKLTKKQERDLSEAIYTMSEAGLIDRFEPPDALVFHALVELAIRGEFIDDMRL